MEAMQKDRNVKKTPSPTVQQDIVMDVLNNVVPFKPEVITGGKGPPGTNWLIHLKRDCLFLAKKIDSKEPDLNLYLVRSKLKRSVWLTWSTPDDRQIDIWVDAQRFSDQWEFVELVNEGKDGDWDES